MNPFCLDGKHIIISGASSGIGRQCAISCSSMGAKVSLLGRNIERLKETLSMMTGLNHCYYSVELTDEDSISNTVKLIVKNSGKINGLLNVAGISSTLPMKLVSEKKIDELFRNNVYSAYLLTKEVCKIGNFSKDGGSIVFLSSIMGTHGEIGKSLYSMSKGALISLSKSLACELASKKIRVNTISPGVIITPINENAPHISDPDKRQELEKKHLLGLGSVVDVANACIFYMSDASCWITGTNLYVDGGYSAI